MPRYTTKDCDMIPAHDMKPGDRGRIPYLPDIPEPLGNWFDHCAGMDVTVHSNDGYSVVVTLDEAPHLYWTLFRGYNLIPRKE